MLRTFSVADVDFMQTMYPDPQTSVERSLPVVQVQTLDVPKPNHRPSEPMVSLDEAIRSCSQYVAEAENGMINGSIQSVRLAFTKAEEALEDAQHFRAEIDGGALPASTAEVINDLGNRLDALWVRLICAFS